MTMVFVQEESFVWKPVHMYVVERDSSRFTEIPLTLLAVEGKKGGVKDTVEVNIDVPQIT